ncbi:peptidoglycan-binding domain-containing protein [Micromonospora sp. NPDC049645]|uniref:peptidoglycan-binding domain-containing protein n=1 Tax=Micromonospora sp. NPDC049645 TaxID=3155508 RepID=UPI0034152F60
MTPGKSLVGRRRRSVLLVALFLASVLLVTVGAVLIGPTLRSPDQLAADAAPPPPSPVTASVERRKLVEPVVLRGRLQPGASVRVFAPAAALGPSSVVTKVLARNGDRAVEGRVLVERSGQPMFALALPFPLYRDLTAGARGPDVAEVQRALRRIGYTVPTSGVLDSTTRRQLTRFYRDRGYQVGGAATGNAVLLPQSDVLLIDRSGRRLSTVHARVGQTLVDPKAPLLELDGQAPTIVATAAVEQAALLRPGQQADVTDDLADARTKAAVDTVGTDAVTGSDGQTGIEVRFRFTEAALTGDANRSVRLDVRTSAAAEVLAVPVTAIYSRPDGSTFVTVVTDANDTTDVTVTTGQTAGGWVELREPAPAPVAAGVSVMVGEQTEGG